MNKNAKRAMEQKPVAEQNKRSRLLSLVHWLFHPGERLSRRVVHAGFWVFALRIVDRLFGLARTVILARLLAPEDFGLFGIALLALSMLETFSETGFNAAIIQKKGDVRPYLDTVWTVQVLRGVFLALVLLAIAPYVAMFFGEPGAASLVRVLALVMVLRGLVNTGVLYFRKELEFHKEFIYRFSGTLVDMAVAIPAALILRNAWALVFGLLAGAIVQLIVSYFIHPYRPCLSSDLGKVRELFGFGRWILGSNILVFLLTQGDDIFVGKLLGVTMLGFYQIAYRISNAPATEISHVISQVTFPAYSKLQDNLSSLREGYLKTLQVTAFISIPLAGGIFILAPEFTTIFLTQKWMPMVPAMQVLALYGMLRAIGATTGVVFMAVGRPEIRTKIQSAQLIMLAILIYPLTIRWGIMGTSIAVTAYALVFNLVAVYKVLNIVKADYNKPTKLLMLPLIGTLAMILVIFVLRTYVFHDISLASFLLLIVAGIFMYLLIAYLADRFFNYGSKQLIREQFAVLFQKQRGE